MTTDDTRGHVATITGEKRRISQIEPSLVVPLAWRKVVLPTNASDAIELIRACLMRRAEILRRMKARAVGASLRRQRDLIRMYCHSEVVRVAVYASVLSGRGADPLLNQVDPIAVVSKGRTLRAESPAQSPMFLFPGGRPGEKLRPVCSFSDWDKARQTVVHDALKAVVSLPDWMFQYRGGDPAAKRWLQSEVPKAKLVLVTDFPKCFPLLPWRQLADGLPISKRAITTLLCDPWNGVSVTGFDGWKRGDPVGPLFLGSLMEGTQGCAGEIGRGRGIPPGSALSSLVAQIVLERILRDLPVTEGVKLGLYADNLVVLLADEALEAPVRNGLMRMVERHYDHIIAAEFLQRTMAFLPGDVFRYLGRAIHWKRHYLKLDSTPAHRARIEGRIAWDVYEADTGAALRRSVGRLQGYAQFHGLGPQAAKALIGSALLVGSHHRMLEERKGVLEDLMADEDW